MKKPNDHVEPTKVDAIFGHKQPILIIGTVMLEDNKKHIAPK